MRMYMFIVVIITIIMIPHMFEYCRKNFSCKRDSQYRKKKKKKKKNIQSFDIGIHNDP